MRRIEALVPYSHDHQHALANAHRLRLVAADGSDDELAQVVEQALAFAGQELAEHLHHEEAILLPQLDVLGVVTDDQVSRIAREHLELRTLHARLVEHPSDRALAAAFAAALHDHVRWEERELFQSWQERLTDAQRPGLGSRLDPAGGATAEPAPSERQVSCQAPTASGATGLALGELNATCVTLAPGVTQGTSADRDVALICVAGTGTLEVAGDSARLAPGSTHLLAAHGAREVAAGSHGITVVTVHRRRSPLHVAAPR
ncbi:MAG: Hemerythrin cation binding region [Thermoleophilia bacterium]|nr:Hemerythrin cation binding region [Thermoleophilia bacterium]